jgi:hypothetical protein
MLCYYIETKEATGTTPFNEAVLFAPIFAGEILGFICTSPNARLSQHLRSVSDLLIFVLAIPPVAFLLMYARRQRGTFCIRIDNGPDVPATEIW